MERGLDGGRGTNGVEHLVVRPGFGVDSTRAGGMRGDGTFSEDDGHERPCSVFVLQSVLSSLVAGCPAASGPAS